jgi:hypothetical protein
MAIRSPGHRLLFTLVVIGELMTVLMSHSLPLERHFHVEGAPAFPASGQSQDLTRLHPNSSTASINDLSSTRQAELITTIYGPHSTQLWFISHVTDLDIFCPQGGTLVPRELRNLPQVLPQPCPESGPQISSPPDAQSATLQPPGLGRLTKAYLDPGLCFYTYGMVAGTFFQNEID